ncbi:MAG TPA: hypothetical protein VEV17_04950 [Bryobacteraceae bacterium]|nr:hypothetical protein [Bryobacteraceae bacterium]
MHSDIQRLKDEYRQLVSEYVDAVHKQEMARLEALPSPSSEVTAEWLRACDNAEQINKRRLEAQYRLRAALTLKA